MLGCQPIAFQGFGKYVCKNIILKVFTMKMELVETIYQLESEVNFCRPELYKILQTQHQFFTFSADTPNL